MKRLSLLLLAILPFCLQAQQALVTLTMPAVFSDNMVLQQKTMAAFWGKAKPSQEVNIKTSWGKTAKTVTAADGKWSVKVATPAAGGPYTVTITSGKESILFQNVLIGEVWICSGQSNMEMPLAGWPPNDTIAGSAYEIAHATNTYIRLFNVTRDLSADPQENCKGNWQICSPEAIKPFSATAYFFAKMVYQNIKVPIGLIETSWGGTPIESWISSGSLSSAGEFADVLTEIKASQPLFKKHVEWVKTHRSIDINFNGTTEYWSSLNFDDAALAGETYNDASWPEMNLPVTFEQNIGDFDGAIWFRTKFSIPEALAGKNLELSLGPIDDMDCVYVNGTKVGGTEQGGYWNVDRHYTIPGNVAKTGENTIAIRVIDTQGGGGVNGKPELLYIREKANENADKISLAGSWKYLPVAEALDGKFYVYNNTINEFASHPRPKSVNASTPSVLYNAMVNPLIPYTIKGGIWYQGEANVGRADQYRKIFPLMITDWRKAWGIGDFPFYFVQIAPWEYGNVNWDNSADLRDAQKSALSLKNTGMAVTLDIGNVKNIHPSNKKDVGERLARWALAKDYGVSMPVSGPLYKSMKIEGNAIRLQFEHTNDGLKAKDGKLTEFEIAGADGIFKKADAKIEGNEVLVSSPEISNPVKARYCWRNGAEASLFNGVGLPASVFKTE